MRVNGEIVFSAVSAVDKERAEESNMDIVRYNKDHIARDLGMKIAEEKGWHDYEEDGLIKSEIRLYVFTPAELRDFCDAKFKAKLLDMAANEEYLTEHQREALRIQSERF
jgi:hypothetical protein